MPDMSGLQLHQELASLGQCRPIIFLSGRGDVPSSVAAMKAGAVDFLTKPVDGELLVEAVGKTIECDLRGSAPSPIEPASFARACRA
jgi:FixJ family two-component response regulator